MMEIEIELGKSAQQNANEYFQKAKKSKRKAEGAVQSVVELEKRLANAKEKLESESSEKQIRQITKREWYEKFHWFFTSNGMLAIGGRDAEQNEVVVAKYFENNDLFFHADVHGADVVILKNGNDAPRAVKEEAAQFAACHSSAWKRGLSSADVYALGKDQVSKSKSGGSLGVGSFAMSGEREWFKNMKLELEAFVKRDEARGVGMFCVVPGDTYKRAKIAMGIQIKPGSVKKSDAAKMIAKRLGYQDIDYIMQQLPAGPFDLI